MVTINVPKSKVTCPQDVIDFLRKPENQNIFSSSKAITETCDSNCVKLRHFFGRPNEDRYGVHYEIRIGNTQDNVNHVFAEIHVEESHTPLEVRRFLQDSLVLVHKPRCRHDSYHGAIHEIPCVGLSFADVVEDIDKAVCDLYNKYEAYLIYVRNFWDEHGNLNGCKSYVDFITNQSRKGEKEKSGGKTIES